MPLGKKCARCTLMGLTTLLSVFGIIILLLGSLSILFGQSSASLGISISLSICGICITIVAILGFLGACRESNVMLAMFVCCLIVVFIIKLLVIIGAVLAANMVDLKKEFLEHIPKYYVSEDLAKFWDDLQQTGKCCGVNDYKDWEKYFQPIPKSCCLQPVESVDAKEQTCRYRDHLFTDGCYAYIESLLYSGVRIMVSYAIGFFLTELLAVISACILLHNIRKENAIIHRT